MSEQRRLDVGDVLVGWPCRVTIFQIDRREVGSVAWGRCSGPECRGVGHVVDVVLFESGKGPWRFAEEVASDV